MDGALITNMPSFEQEKEVNREYVLVAIHNRICKPIRICMIKNMQGVPIETVDGWSLTK
jgi:penicillin V acylase-like amidase (Ntn superfamily)